MSQVIPHGTKLTTLDGEEVEVQRQFDRGGQGYVFFCRFRGEKRVLKIWIEGATTAEQRKQLVENLRVGSPSKAFAWPIAVVVDGDGEVVGYVMPFVGGNGYGTLQSRLFGACDATYFALTTAGIETTKAMVSLHGHGCFYGDLNTNNLLFHHKHGATRLVDVDNVVYEGCDIGVAYSFGAAAPSIVLGKSKPGMQGDLYALACIHFMLLVGGLPLEGKRAATACAPDFEAMKRLHGSDPLFVFDPADDRNRPDPVAQSGMAESWALLPKNLRAMFTQSFTAGLHDPHARYGEAAWRDALVALRDAIALCGKCGAHVFTVESERATCWHCQSAVDPKRQLTLGDRRVVVNPGVRLYPHHIDKTRRGDLSGPVAAVVSHPTDRGRLGLENRSAAAWSLTTVKGERRSITAGDVAPLARGNRIGFGTAEAVVG